MKTLHSQFMLSITTALLVVAPMACDQSAPTPPKNAATAATSSLPKDLFITQEPAGALGVLKVRQSAKAGDHVAMIGRIGGSINPFVSNRAVFTMVDASLTSCLEMGDAAHCPTPADYCCEDSNELAKAMASVTITDKTGKPLAISLATEGSLKPLMWIAVEGTLQPMDGGAFIVNADHIYKMPNDPLASRLK
ncbi:MAG: hypothetical protein EXS12_08545 [Phycisphaerales bacterium]|nr:hypothetical protein [Phycisphaerales bacterium]